MVNMIKKRRQLYSWQQGLLNGKFQIIHAMSSTTGVGGAINISPFQGAKFEDVISTWDVMSCSLLSYSKGRGRGALPTHLVLDVPYQNILGTHLSDVWFPNHAGKLMGLPTGQLINPYSLVDCINSGKGVLDNSLGKPFNTLEYFKCFILMMKPNDYNEILIICKPNLLVVNDVPKTGRVKLKDIVYNVYADSLKNSRGDIEGDVKVDIETVKRIAEINQLKSVSFIFNYEKMSPYYFTYIKIYDEIRRLFGEPIYSSFNQTIAENNNFASKLRTAPNLSYAYHPLGGERDLAVFPVN
ncbi:hypothetical protein ymoll0001_35340 [Yersinia mollaretii ATCC 43969]|uniref:Uncharacterized protein n=2 Tax=Yersinia mollaretii TaxID=33060 RepID=A0ABP2EHD4_YERMW|nr:hypothetical protein [Yersinia mollaretii]EEQ11772.1 hypothetical protein ymoll0001_35340 [Yersinia mollaretii ATCC 43969]QKJ01958.1 hypothetical protein HRD69_02485 [Yersinia mollaretii ATCC 43969]